MGGSVMRIRSILPKFYESEDIGAMDWHTRLVFVGLWSYADDNGVGRDVPSLIAADLFPFDLSRDSRDTLARVADALQTLSAGGQIIRYTLEKKPLYFIVKWDEYQRVDRPAKTRYERPTSTNAEIRETVATVSRDRRETVATGEGEKGRRGEVKTRPNGADDPDFEAFYQAYPRHEARAPALKAYKTARKTTPAQVLLDAITRQKPRLTAEASGPKFIPLPATWLNGQRWLDETAAPAPVLNSWMRSERKIPASWLEGEPVL